MEVGRDGMAKVKPYEINDLEKKEAIFILLEIISTLKNRKEITDFFLGLFTPSESLMFARRLQIAKMLVEDKSYFNIQTELKVSSQTVHRTDQWLHKGGEEYYNWLKKRLTSVKYNKEFETEKYSSLLDKYSYHRFLRDLFK